MHDNEPTLGEMEKPEPHTEQPTGDPNLGRRIGPYRIERRIARGGMGTVYLAVRQDDFEQRVALKLIRPNKQPLSDGNEAELPPAVEVLRRFFVERRILARLEHPGIARIFDGGTTDDSLPFFVMEYVEGEPVDRYCDRLQLPMAGRLELFRQICEAVHFAHQNLVVHRDLKPDNILVTADGAPKLLDFGIAKVLHPEPDPSDTRDGQPMTPDFASPEQVLGRPVTTASDVYSLGVLLYRLMSGRSPYRMAGLDAGQRAELIRRNEPKPPSTVAPRAVRRRLTGDIDAIVGKAMRKDPRQRYSSAEGLAEDLRRHLTDLPIKADAGTWLYRARKLARRHRWSVALAGLVLGFAVTVTVLWRQAVNQRTQAEKARLRAEKVSSFLEDLFKSADPDTARGQSLTVREVLDQGREQLADELVEQPEVRARLLSTLGTVYNNLALYQDAREVKQEALRSRRAADPTDRQNLAADLNNLGRLHYDLGEYEAAEKRFREALEMWRRLGDEAGSVLALRNLAAVLMHRGKTEQALDLHTRVLETQRQLHGPDEPETADSLYSLGSLYRIRGEPKKAVPLLRQALEIYHRRLGLTDPRVASVEGTLGRVLHSLNRLPEAREHYERALRIRLQLYGDDHVRVAASRKNLADLLLAEGETEAAGQLLEPALETLRRQRPAGDRMIADAGSVWGSYLVARGHYAEAEPYLLEGHRTLLEIRGEDHVDTRAARRRLDALYTVWEGRPPPLQ